MDPQQQQPEPALNQPPAPSPLPPSQDPDNSQAEQTLGAQQYVQAPTQLSSDVEEPGYGQDHEPELEAITWEASESIHHEKDTLWFVGVTAGALLLSIISIFFVRSWTFTILIIVMAAAVIMLAKRPPRVLQYQMTEHGIDVNERHHSFQEFRAFGIVEDGPFYYVSLLPIKRFMPAMDVYFPEEYGEDIVDILGSQIPMQTIKPDMLDMVTKKLRF